MAITLTTNFGVNTNLPLDDRFVAADLTARDAILSGRRFEGLLVYVVAEQKMYQLQGGITNLDWIEAGSASATVSSGLTAFAGGGQGSATTLPSTFNQISTVATSGDSVKVQAAFAGLETVVINDGANTMDIFPESGDEIDNLGANNAIQLDAGKNMRFVCAVDGFWKSMSSAGGVGAGGGSLQWVEDDSVPVSTTEYGNQIYLFPLSGSERIYALIKVPANYVAGKQISMDLLFYSPDNTGSANFSNNSHLIRPGVHTINSTSVVESFNGSGSTLSAGTVDIPQNCIVPLTDGVGEINGTPIQAGDMLKVVLTRDAADTATSDLRLLPFSAELVFA